jgi:hypothetical protein
MDVTEMVMSGIGVLLVWSIQRQYSATSQNTTAIAVLTSQVTDVKEEIKGVREDRFLLRKQQEDLNVAHSRIRDLQSEIKKINH